MAFKIKKQDQKEVEAALAELAAKRAELEKAVELFNTRLSDARAELAEVVDAYNEQAETVRGKIEDIHRELDDEYSDKSDKWQESDRASTVADWMGEVEQYGQDIEDAVIDAIPESLEMDDVISTDPAEAWGELEKEPQE